MVTAVLAVAQFRGERAACSRTPAPTLGEVAEIEKLVAIADTYAGRGEQVFADAYYYRALAIAEVSAPAEVPRLIAALSH